jgi:hypothetical protein
MDIIFFAVMVVLTLIFPFIFQKSFWKAGVGLGALDGWPIYQWQQTYGDYRSAEGGHIQGPVIHAVLVIGLYELLDPAT